MPIKAENRNKYPEHWDKLSLFLREKAGWRCELCQSANGFPQKITKSKVVLTVHHISGDPTDNRKINLIVLCQRCHNILDQPFRRPKRNLGLLIQEFPK